MRMTLTLVTVLSFVDVGCTEDPQEPQAKAAAATPQGKVEEAPPAKLDAAVAKEPKAKPKTRAQRDKLRKTFAAELGQLDNDRDGFEKLSRSAPKTRLHHERIAGIYLQRARLSGSYDDYAKAQASIDRAFELNPLGSAFMLRAKLHYTLHRLPEAREDFAKAKTLTQPTPDAVSSLEAFEANLALQAGDDKTAAKHFEASLAAKRTTSSLSSAAVFHWKIGDFDKAEALFREALKAYHGKPMEPRAWLNLNLGLLDLDRGRYDDALAHYREAETFLKGYWLIDEHIAEILTLQGKTQEAKTLYLDIIERTNNPEFMDAMAGIAFEAGKDDEGKEWVAKARKRYEEQMAQYPEAAYGHALGHYLEFGDDPAFALELAQKNYDLRPNLEAAVMLAQARLGAGDAKAAKKALAPTLKSAFESAELYATAAEVESKLGNTKKAEALLKQAQAIDPTAELAEPAEE